jgi:hypothetical protein
MGNYVIRSGEGGKVRYGSFAKWFKALIDYTLLEGAKLAIRYKKLKGGKLVREPLDEDSQELAEKLKAVSVNKVPSSVFQLVPGDIMAFYYNLEGSGWRVVLVVSNKRGPSGWFRAQSQNMLNSCYRIDTVMPETLEIILKVIYKARNRSNYYKLLPFFRNVFGETWGLYRTYRMDRIQSMYEIYYEM